MWKDYENIVLSDLKDDENYLLRHQNADGRWSCPYLGWWDAEEGRFFLHETIKDFKVEVDQVMEIPE